MSDKTYLTRRAFLQGAGMISAGVVLAACAPAPQSGASAPAAPRCGSVAGAHACL